MPNYALQRARVAQRELLGDNNSGGDLLSQSFDALVERERGLQHSLSTGQMSMIAIGGAIGTGLFLGSAFAIGFAGPSVLVSYAIGGVISLLLMGFLAMLYAFNFWVT